MSVMYICDICDVYVVSFVCLGGIEKTNKNVYTGHFAVSHSAKRHALPSATQSTLQRT
jgi:hypothetical protein